MPKYEAKPLAFKNALKGLSEKTMAIHHDKLYVGYVNKKNEIADKLWEYVRGGKDLATANQTYSELRSLKDGLTFAANGVYLHEYYFNLLAGDGKAQGPLVDAITETFGPIDQFLQYFKACGMAARGWAVLAWNTHEAKLNVYTADAHNQGGVWGAIPIIVLDVYEHAYFIDYGSDRAKYIDEYIANLNWDAATAVYEKAKLVTRD